MSTETLVVGEAVPLCGAVLEADLLILELLVVIKVEADTLADGRARRGGGDALVVFVDKRLRGSVHRESRRQRRVVFEADGLSRVDVEDHGVRMQLQTTFVSDVSPQAFCEHDHTKAEVQQCMSDLPRLTGCVHTCSGFVAGPTRFRKLNGSLS